jgi:hypothetical protein
MKFESVNKSALKWKLHEAGYVIDEKARPNAAGQLHQWCIPSTIRGHVPRRMTMRNAAKQAGLITG